MKNVFLLNQKKSYTNILIRHSRKFMSVNYSHFLKIIFILFLGVGLANNVNAQWQVINNGIFGGRIVAIVSDSNFIYAGTENAGIYRSNDNGQSWIPLNNGLEDLRIYSLAIKGNTIFAGTHYKGIFRSNDFGVTWNAINTGVTPFYQNSYNRVYNIIVNDTNVYFSEGSKIYKSNNNGNSWSQLVSYINLNIGLVNFEIVNNTIFCITSSNLKISYDYGNTWVVPTGLDTIVYNIKSIGNYIFAICRNGIYRSSDIGHSWVSVQTGLPPYFDINAKLYFFNNNIYINDYPTLFYSSNYGNSWSLIYKNNKNFNIINSLIVKNNKLFVATNTGAYSSNINDTTWSFSSNGIINNIPISDIEISGQNLYAVGNLKLYKSINNGVNWFEVNNNLPDNFYLNQIAIINNKMFAASLINSWILMSSDNGITWAPIINGLIQPYFETNSLNVKDNNLYACTNDGLFRYNLNDTSWEDISPVPGGYYSISFTDSLIFTSSKSGHGYYSSNNCLNWNNVDSIWSPNTYIKKDSFFYVLNNWGVIYSSSDLSNWKYEVDGLNWYSNNNNYGISTISLIGNKLFATGIQGVLLFNNDSSYWNSESTGLPINYYPNIPFDGGVNFIKTDGINVYVSVGSKGIWKRSLSELLGLVNIIYINKPYTQIISPNPVQDILNITNISLGSTISIYDINGKLLMNEKANQTLSIDVSRFAKGIYIAKIQTENEVISQKFIKE